MSKTGFVKAKVSGFIKQSEWAELPNADQDIDDWVKAKKTRCNATNKRNGKQCSAKAIKGTAKCYMHGGASTGAKTPEGKARSLANLKQYRDKK